MRAVIAGLVASLATFFQVARAEQPATTTAWDYTFTSIDGKPMPLSEYKGNVLLVVNVASFCGFTPQYKGLQALYDKYQGQGLTVIGVPSNDFGNQEPKAAGEIKEFCQGTYGVKFPLTAKAALSGDDAHPFYVWAREQLGWLNAPKWNFHKYLVGRDGRLVTSFVSTTTPDANRLVSAVETELAKGAMSRPDPQPASQ
ncbi:MAG: glutathione peroxidase [Hyphomicrobiaceae bacterium]|nr:glutathione peroxidase [Hyphomicrobiaceae bacterium]